MHGLLECESVCPRRIEDAFNERQRLHGREQGKGKKCPAPSFYRESIALSGKKPFVDVPPDCQKQGRIDKKRIAGKELQAESHDGEGSRKAPVCRRFLN